jgi:hypothetical protein
LRTSNKRKNTCLAVLKAYGASLARPVAQTFVRL